MAKPKPRARKFSILPKALSTFESTSNQQACASMKEIVKEHPLRPIILRFDPKKKPLAIETQALNAYYRQHDHSWAVKQDLLQHQKASEEIDQAINALEQALQQISEQRALQELAIESHHQALQALGEKVILESRWYNDALDYVYENEGWLDEQHGQGDELIHELYRHYDKVSVDIVSFDRDQQEFFGSVGEIRKLQSRYFEFAEFVFERYHRLHAESELLYQQAMRMKK